MKSAAMLILRATVGPLMMAHGAQKLFGWFGGHGLQGTSGWLESNGFRPGRPWALLASLGEFGGGVLTTLGFLNPAGPLGVIGAMSMAATKFHAGKPVFASEGGPELPLTNIGIAAALALAGPGKYSVDTLLGIRLPRWVLIPGALATAAVVGAGLRISQQAQAADSAATEKPAEDVPAAEATSVPQAPMRDDAQGPMDQLDGADPLWANSDQTAAGAN